MNRRNQAYLLFLMSAQGVEFIKLCVIITMFLTSCSKQWLNTAEKLRLSRLITAVVYGVCMKQCSWMELIPRDIHLQRNHNPTSASSWLRRGALSPISPLTNSILTSRHLRTSGQNFTSPTSPKRHGTSSRSSKLRRPINYQWGYLNSEISAISIGVKVIPLLT